MRRWLVGDALVAEDEARVSAADRGLLFGDGLFETLRVYGGRPFLLAEHWARLHASARVLGIVVPEVDPAEIVGRVLRANDLADAVVRLTLTRGPGAASPRPSPGATPTLLVHTRPLRPDLADFARRGVAGVRLPWPLRARGLPLQGHKTLSYVSSVLALGSVGAGEEPILETTEGHLSETATANLFWVRSGTLATPHLDAGCLPGIARELVLRLAAAAGLRVVEGLFPAGELASAEEAFLTNSVQEVIPLARLDGLPIGAGVRGPVTEELQRAYRGAVERATVAPA